jgi:arylsulfatase A-like enzyme
MSQSRRQFFTETALGAVASTRVAGLAAPAAVRPMNVLFIISDQHQAACMGNEGHPLAITPNLDRLAAGGVRFTNAYTQNPICTPSRVSVFSGQYCHNHGMYGMLGPVPPVPLPSFLLHFRRNGYKTAAIGKVHAPEKPVSWIKAHCDLFADARGPKDDNPYKDYIAERGLSDKEDSTRWAEFPQHKGMVKDGRPSNLEYRDSIEGWSVTTATRFMDSCHDQPFCMQVSLPKPHPNWVPARRFWDMYGDGILPRTLRQSAAHRPPHFQKMVEGMKNMEWLLEPKTFEAGAHRIWRAYLACITHTDYAVGELLDYLEKTGKAANTIVIYSADHGSYSGTYGVPEKAPGICSEAVCRVPFIWRVPGITKAGYACRQLVENIDIASTMTSLCGVPAMDTTDGQNITELLRGGAKPVREAAVTEDVWSKALRWGPWRFVHYERRMFGHDVGELYNLEEDPDETRNLYEDKASQPVVQECRRLLLDWMISTTRCRTLDYTPAGTNSLSLRAEDGTQSNKVTVADRLKHGGMNYI